MTYETPTIADYGDLTAITQGCLGGVQDDTFGDTQTFPALSGIICGP